MVRERPSPWRSIPRRDGPQIARIILVAAVSWQICVLIGATQPPVFAVLVPLVCLRDDAFSVFNLSIARLVGVVAGLLIAIEVLQLLQPDTLAIAVVLALALLAGMVLRVGNVINNQVAISALLVFSSPDASGYAVARLWETGIGTATTLVLAPLLFPANPFMQARAELQDVTRGLVAALRSSTALTGRPGNDAAQQSILLGIIDQLVGLQTTLQLLAKQLAAARKSARWTVLRRSAMHAAADLETTRCLASRLATHLENFAEEVTTFGGHPQFTSDPTLQPAHLARLVEPLQTSLTAALSGQPFMADLNRARTAIEEYRAEDHSGGCLGHSPAPASHGRGPRLKARRRVGCVGGRPGVVWWIDKRITRCRR